MERLHISVCGHVGNVITFVLGDWMYKPIREWKKLAFGSRRASLSDPVLVVAIYVVYLYT